MNYTRWLRLLEQLQSAAAHGPRTVPKPKETIGIRSELDVNHD